MKGGFNGGQEDSKESKGKLKGCLNLAKIKSGGFMLVRRFRDGGVRRGVSWYGRCYIWTNLVQKF